MYAGGSLYLTDSANHRVCRVDTVGKISTVASNGTRGFAGDGGPAADAELAATGLAVDPGGNPLIAENGVHYVRDVALGEDACREPAMCYRA